MPSSPADDPNTIRGPVSLGPGIVKLLLDAMQSAIHTQVEKPWGGEDIWDCGQFILKVIFVDEGQQTSLQHHEIKDEVQFIADVEDDGGVLVREADGYRHYVASEIVRITPGTIHRTVGPCTLIEVTTPENDDVIRHEDDYNRVEIEITPDTTAFKKAYEKPTLTQGEVRRYGDMAADLRDYSRDEPPGYSAGIQELGYEGDG